MTPGKFLRLLWPDVGYYCIATQFVPKGQTEPVWVHRAYPTISEAVSYVHEIASLTDVYFAMLSLREDRVWDPTKKNWKTGEPGAWTTRTQYNMLASRCFFFDLDVGSGEAKYPTQRDALVDLVSFLEKTQLPEPTVVSSGGGVHVYWHFDSNLPAEDWRAPALYMRQLAEHYGLKVDPKRTTDVASVLRVPDTYNWKQAGNPRPVKVMGEGVITSTANLLRKISDALIRAGVTPEIPSALGKPPIAGAEGLGSNIEFRDFGPPPTLEDVTDACAQAREIIRTYVDPTHPYYGDLDNTAWYQGMISLFRHIENGPDLCRQLTALFPRTNADVEFKLRQAEPYGPTRCEKLREFMPWKGSACEGCRFRNDPSTPNPLVAARKSAVAPPPVVSIAPPPPPGAGIPPPPPPAAQLTAAASPHPSALQTLIPNPPKPYERLKTGEIAITRKDKDGEETTTVIYENDLYPLRRLVNSADSTEQQIWRVTLPRTGTKEFVIDADVLYDSRRFASTMANNGIYPHKADISALQDYMVAYINRLQKELDATLQSNHLGWADDHRKFILPDKVLHADGLVHPSSLTKAAKKSTQHITKRGSMLRQIELLRFYEDDRYLPNQTVILDAFASILFSFTGHHGIVVNCSGDAGASKSTTLQAAASVWGDAAMLPLNGTNRGATANARTQKLATHANLPTFMDEITLMPPRDAADMVMSITQPGHRLRLQTDGTERKHEDGYKSAIMVTTANSSLHTLLSIDNSAGTAGSMRVFEIHFKAQSVHTKAQADEFLRELRDNYGWLGEVFAHYVVRNLAAVRDRVHAKVREIDAVAGIQTSERFWSARIATTVVACEICNELGLLFYDPVKIQNWQVNEQVPLMRGVVLEEYRDPLAILTDYIAESNSHIVVVDKSTAIGANTSGVMVAGDTAFAVNNPHGSLEGHFDMKAGVLLLRKQGFKEYCNRIGASSSRIIEELSRPRARGSEPPARVITSTNVRRTIGAGTPLAKGQTWCFVVNMRHPEIAGEQLVGLPGGAQLATSAPAGNLAAISNDT